MPNVYLDQSRAIARRAFSMWNRDPASPSFGSFDRVYWGWKFKDLSDATLQFGARLAIEHAQLSGNIAVLPDLLQGYVAFVESIQHRDGSFDQCYPHESAPGVVYDFLGTLGYVRNSPHLSTDGARALDGVIERAVEFALRTDEKHGEVANHIAGFAAELLAYAAWSGHAGARARGEQYLERLLSLFDRSEGWFLEYQGPDAGYQTRTLRFLAKIALLGGRPEVTDAMRKAAGFIAQVMMPDGSIHPMLGCRSTALLYPSAFEMLGGRFEELAGLARRVRESWERGTVPLPTSLDFANAIRLADDAYDAAQYAAQAGGGAARMPEGDAEFGNAGIRIRRTPDRVVYVGEKLGGVVVVYARSVDGEWKLAGEDAGYLLKSKDKTRSWVSRQPGAGQLAESSGERCVIRTRFFRSLHDEVTPIRLIVLRLLNLTLLRSQWIADLFRKLVVARLISGQQAAPVILEREIVIAPGSVRVSDRIACEDGAFARGEAGALYRCRRITGAHMASARYFQEQELEALPLAWMEPVPGDWSTQRVHCVEYPSAPQR